MCDRTGEFSSSSGIARSTSVNAPRTDRFISAAAEEFLFPGSVSTADGSSLVRLGDTTVVCGVKAEIAEPDLDAPEDGFLGIASIGARQLGNC